MCVIRFLCLFHIARQAGMKYASQTNNTELLTALGVKKAEVTEKQNILYEVNLLIFSLSAIMPVTITRTEN